jgi:hypothetical protein
MKTLGDIGWSDGRAPLVHESASQLKGYVREFFKQLCLPPAGGGWGIQGKMGLRAGGTPSGL